MKTDYSAKERSAGFSNTIKGITVSLIIFGLASSTWVGEKTDLDGSHLATPPPTGRGPQGWGIFQKVHRQHQDKGAINLTSPYLTGVETGWSWGELEPEEGKYEWQVIDSYIEPWVRAGKKVIIKITTCQKQDPAATPGWVFEAGAKKIEFKAPDKFVDHETKRRKTFPASVFPVFWDKTYLEKYSGFIAALGQRYNGHPGVEMIEMGLGHNTGFAIVPWPELLQEYEAHGYTKEVWLHTMLTMADAYREAFPDTPLMVVTGPIERDGMGWSDPDLDKYCAAFAERGIWLYSHNLTGNEKWADKRIPFVYSKLHPQTKTILGVDNPTWKKNMAGGDGNAFYGGIRDIARNAIGGTGGIPKSGISYFIFYYADVSASMPGNENYIPEYEEVMKWIAGKLKKPDSKGRRLRTTISLSNPAHALVLCMCMSGNGAGRRLIWNDREVLKYE